MNETTDAHDRRTLRRKRNRRVLRRGQVSRTTPPKKRAGKATGPRRLDGQLWDVHTVAAMMGVPPATAGLRLGQLRRRHVLLGAHGRFTFHGLFRHYPELDTDS